jgi:hypothetical protein
MTSTLVVSVEPPWPSVHGGRLRTARLAEALRDAGHRVTVAAPGLGEVWSAPPGIATVELSTRPAGSPAIVRGALSLRPKVGVVHLGRCTDAIAALATEAEVVVWAQPYVAAVAGPAPGCVEVIDVQNVEAARAASMAATGSVARRLLRHLEAVKAARWEPTVWRRAAVCLALNDRDAAVVAAAGAHVVLAPNGIDVHPVVTSPSAAVVGLVASYTYGPNVDAARWFVGHVWPAVRAVRPDAVLVVAGRGADRAVGELAGEGIEVIADFDDARALYARTAVVVAPVRTGGGSQLKVTEALSHHRVVVASPYSAEAAPATARDAGAVVVADTVGQWVDALVRLLVEVDDRRRIEAALGEPGVMPTWDRTLRDAVEAIDAAVAGHDHRRAGGPVRRRRRLR